MWLEEEARRVSDVAVLNARSVFLFVQITFADRRVFPLVTDQKEKRSYTHVVADRAKTMCDNATIRLLHVWLCARVFMSNIH